jgi:hypothetical protein
MTSAGDITVKKGVKKLLPVFRTSHLILRSVPGVYGCVSDPRHEPAQPAHHVDDGRGHRCVRVRHVHVHHAVQVRIEQGPVVPDAKRAHKTCLRRVF